MAFDETQISLTDTLPDGIDPNPPPTSTTNHEFTIRKSSFTAFRLTYYTPKQMADYSKVVFLGGVPSLWLEDQKPGLLQSINHLTRRSLTRQLDNVMKYVNSSIIRSDNFQGEPEQKDPHVHKGARTEEFKLFNRVSHVNTISLTNELSDPLSHALDSEISNSQGEYSEEDSDFQEEEDLDEDEEQRSQEETSTLPVETPSTSKSGSSSSPESLPNGFEGESMALLESLFYKSNKKRSRKTEQIIGWESTRDSFFDDPETDSDEEIFYDSLGYIDPPNKSSEVQSSFSPSTKTITLRTAPQLFPVSLSTQSSTPFTTAKAEASGVRYNGEEVKNSILLGMSPPIDSIFETPSDEISTYSGTSKSNAIDKALNFNSIDFPEEPIAKFSTLPHPTRIVHNDGITQENPNIGKEKLTKRIKFAANELRKNIRRTKKEENSHSNQNTDPRAWLLEYEQGDIIKAEKMLVLVKYAASLEFGTVFTEEEPYETRIMDRWNEYVVVARFTGNYDEPLLIQLYRTNVIPKNEQNSDKNSVGISFQLSGDSSVNFYSTVDKTIAISVPNDSGTHIYILRCRTQNSSVRWMSFIKEALGQRLDRQFHVTIPDLHTAIDVVLPLKVSERLVDETTRMRNLLTVSHREKGYDVQYTAAIEYMKNLIIQKLITSTYPKEKLRAWMSRNSRLHFAFRYYDRLEWIAASHSLFHSNWTMTLDYSLELRPLKHHSRKVELSSNQVMREPTPIEGFLAKLTTRGSREKSKLGRTVYKPMYFHTNDNLLFFSKYYRGLPPIIETGIINGNGEVEDMDKLKEKVKYLPQIFEYSPYVVDENEHFSWLNENTTKEEFEINDRIALTEMERRTHSVAKAQAMVDICDIQSIVPIPLDEVKQVHIIALSLAWYKHVGRLEDESIIDSCFRICFADGSKIDLQAPNRLIRDEWVKRLLHMRKYWIAKRAEDLSRILYTRRKNMDILKINEYMDSNLGSENSKADLENTIADPQIYPISNIAMAKPVLMSGPLYQKQRKHSNFNPYYVVLCPGFVILYSMYKRSKLSGVAGMSANYEHYMSIPLSNCYIYSGTTTSSDLLSRQKQFDHMNPGRHSLPRVYSDGWRSSEEETSRCFTLFFATRKAITDYRSISEKRGGIHDPTKRANNSLPKNPGMIKMIRKLGFTGNSIVFMTRSRQERELWVHKIFTEIDRFSTNDTDIQVID